VSFVTTSVEAHFRLIEKRHGIRLLREVIAGFEPVEAAAGVASFDTSTSGIKSRRN
jgi:hypothetical protein